MAAPLYGPSDMPMKRAVTYARVSYYDPEGEKLESQLEMCREHVEKHGYVLVNELTEDDRSASGATFDLPALNQALEMAKAGQIDVIVTREMDRFARGLAKQFVKEFEFESAGVQVEYVLGQYDDTPEGQLTKHVRAIIAEYEREKTLERTTRGRLRSIKSGNVYTGGWSPFGYRLAEVDGKRTLVVHEEEADWVRQIFDWYVNGDGEKANISLSAIARKLSAQGVLTAADQGNAPSSKKSRVGQWGPSSVRTILGNLVYTGQWTYTQANGETLTVFVEPIINQTLFDAAKRQLEKNRLLSRRNVKHNYLLRGRIFCGCGYRMIGTFSRTRRHKRIFYYRCRGKLSTSVKPCKTRMVRADFIEQLAWDAICEAISNPDELADRLRSFQDRLEQQSAPTRRRIEQIDAAIERHKSQMGLLLDLYLDGQYSREVLQSRHAQIEKQIDELVREQASLLQQVDVQPVNQFASLTEFSNEIRDALDFISGDFDRQRWVIDRLDLRVTVEPNDQNGRRITVEAHDYPLVVLDCD